MYYTILTSSTLFHCAAALACCGCAAWRYGYG